MIYLNRNVTLNQLKELVQKNINHKIDYMSDDFNSEQKNALELFQKRIFLEEIIEETISFNKKISWNNSNKHLSLTTTAEELIGVYKLRSDVYKDINYQREFPDEIEGLNFDIFDKQSAILFYKMNNEITGSIRIIIDSQNKLPTDKYYSFDKQRKTQNLCELSRLVIKQKNKGLKMEFKHLFKAIYEIQSNTKNNLDKLILSITKTHYKFYSKFGGINIEQDRPEGYGNLRTPFLILTWNPTLISNYFERYFLK